MKVISTDSIFIELEDDDFNELDFQLQFVGKLFEPYYLEPYGGYDKFRETDWMIDFANTFLKVVSKLIPNFRLSSNWELFRDCLASRVKGCVHFFCKPVHPYIDKFAKVTLSSKNREEIIVSCFQYMVQLHIEQGLTGL